MSTRPCVSSRTTAAMRKHARHRLKFVERSLNHRAIHGDGVEYLGESAERLRPAEVRS
ncbi:hypothetical protein [Streptomyces sp. NPDC000851]